MADILNLSTVGMKKTHLMFQANLSYEQLMHYIRELQGKGMLEQNMENATTIYCTTERGKEFLSHFSKMSKLMGLFPEADVPLLTQ